MLERIVLYNELILEVQLDVAVALVRPSVFFRVVEELNRETGGREFLDCFAEPRRVVVKSASVHVWSELECHSTCCSVLVDELIQFTVR